ncbi:AMP-binding protein [Vibrio sp. CAIM 722]|uniref:AMP-binding protein n=1 Tax=Vibrio eleionomae TaxID=2653505 RepID=A0A7X4RTW5_9VIBR|nr:long-chain fatty acid--CoA ligase [Vibrio eleionomae]MZI92484.1 AMP-binding protein [Vibrio eleionomae]
MAILDFHIVDKLRDRMTEGDERVAMRFYADNDWHDISWSEFDQHTRALSLAMLACGLDVQEKVGIFATNMPRWTICDVAAQQIRVVTVPIYPTSTPNQTKYITENADVRILFVSGQQQLDIAISIFNQCERLERIVIMDEHIEIPDVDFVLSFNEFISLGTSDYLESLYQRLNTLNLDDLFTLIYTSGTTGQPKGVMLSHRNLSAQMTGHDSRLNLTPDDISLCFLPLSHVFERAWCFYVLYKGATNCYLHDVKVVREALQQVSPTVMCAVPRFYEKIYAAVHDKVSHASWLRKTLFSWALSVGERYVSSGKGEWRFRIADKLVLSKLRALLGGRLKMMPCGGAKLEPSIGRFFHALGINVKVGYGMTETTATVSCWPDSHFDANSIGLAMPDVDIRIGVNNEILVKGPMVMQGYYKNESDTLAAFDQDGYLKTGDAGYIDEHGQLFITERIKELMKTSGGKYIAPQMIEGTLGKDHYIEQIAVIADARQFVSALIVPCYDRVEKYARELNIKYHDRIDLLKHAQIIEMFEKRIHELQLHLAHFEQVKKFTLLPNAFSLEDGELTPTLKLRRKVIHTRYEGEIKAMYGK